MSICWHFKWSKADFLSLTNDEVDAAAWVARKTSEG